VANRVQGKSVAHCGPNSLWEKPLAAHIKKAVHDPEGIGTKYEERISVGKGVAKKAQENTWHSLCPQ
jgi:hypothetical protein